MAIKVGYLRRDCMDLSPWSRSNAMANCTGAFDWRLTENPSHSTEFHLLSVASLSTFPTLSVELKEGFIQHTQVCQYVHLDRKSAFKHQLRNCAGLANPVAFLRLRHLPALANRISHFHTLSTRVSQPWGCPLSGFLRGGRRKRQQKFFVPPGVR